MGTPAHEELAAQVEGPVLGRGDDGYEEARAVWNGRFDRRPDLIVRCASEDDAVAAVRFARAHAVPIAVKSGGHDYSGNSSIEGGLLIDLSLMDSVEIDPENRRAKVQAGVRWGAFDAAAQAHGLATTGGSVSTVGVAGYTLGGGTGHFSRAFGLAVDNLVGATLVTASGEHVHASQSDNPDLFWAIRGGGGNFGLATSFEYRLHPLGPEVFAGQIIYSLRDAPRLLRAYSQFVAEAPDEVGCYAFIIRLPPVPAFPEQYHGQLALDFVVSYAGPMDAGETVFAPLRGLADPILEAVGPQPYTALQQSFDAGCPAGNRWFSRAHCLDSLSDDVIGALLGAVEPFPGSFTMVYLEPQGGAVNRVEPTATAFPHRGAAYQLHVFPGWSDPDQDEECMTWARRFDDAMAPFADGGVYSNLLGDDEVGRVPAAYGVNYARLTSVKQQWDPDNVFRSNHNIPPDG